MKGTNESFKKALTRKVSELFGCCDDRFLVYFCVCVDNKFAG